LPPAAEGRDGAPTAALAAAAEVVDKPIEKAGKVIPRAIGESGSRGAVFCLLIGILYAVYRVCSVQKMTRMDGQDALRKV
jgi:hypothetical protein